MKGKVASCEATSGKSADETAKLIGISRSKVEKAIAVMDKATPEIKAAVDSGTMTINKEYETTRKKKVKPPKTMTTPSEEGTTLSAPQNSNVATGSFLHDIVEELKALWARASSIQRQEFLLWVEHTTDAGGAI